MSNKKHHEESKHENSKKEAPEPAEETMVTLKPEEHAALLKKIEEAEALKDKMLRTAADYENAKKRLVREKEDFLRFANERLIAELLPVLDNLNRAIEQAEKANPADPIIKGIHLIEKHVFDVLKKYGLTRVEALGKPFSANFHEALGEVETADKEEGTVVDELESGYLLHDKLLRPARVRIAKTPKAPETPELKEGTSE